MVNWQSVVTMNARNGQLRCGECDAVFNKQSSLNRHGHIHSGAFRCARDGCEKAFSSPKHLSKHLNRHSSTNLQVRIVPFNIRIKVDVKQEPSDEFGGGSSQQSVKPLKRVKKEEEQDEVKVKIELKDEHDHTGDGHRDNGLPVGGCWKIIKKEEDDDESYCGCDECDTELGRHKTQTSTTKSPPVTFPHLTSIVTSSPLPSSSARHANNIETNRDKLFDGEQMDNDEDFEEGQFGLEYDDGQMMQIEEEERAEDGDENVDEDTEIDSANGDEIEEEVGNGDDETDTEDNEGDEEESQTVENTQIETTLPHPNGQTQEIVAQFARHSKRKLTHEVDYQENEQDGSDVEVPSSPVKRPRPTTSSSTKQKQIITHTLQCHQCGLVFVQSELLTKHLWDDHSSRRYRCLVKGCRESFDYKHILSLHLAQSHQSTSQWHCDKCDKHYSTYNRLSVHNISYHQLGHFQCSFPACTFTGEHKKKVISHYTEYHKNTFACPRPDCPFRAPNEYKLKLHKRTHLGIKPYKCKWRQCDFSSAQRGNTITHIRAKHFKGKPSSKVRLDDYVEANEMLLHNLDAINDDWNVDNTKQNSQIITRTLQCPQCGLMFAKLNKHLKEHSIGPFSCAVKDCNQSFDTRHSLGHHLTQSHQSTNQWHCDKCDRHFTSYSVLSNHNIKHHQFGHFQCSISDCTFTAEYRIKVYNHYSQHTRTLMSQD